MKKHIDKLHHHTKRNYHFVGAIITIITILFINHFIDLNTIGIILNEFQSFFKENLILGIITYQIITIIILNSPISITPTLYILAGFLYGAIFGSILAVLSFTIASFIGFELVRHLFRKKFQKRYAKRINKINEQVQEHGLQYFFSLRTMVIVPHYLITILAGLSKVNSKKFNIASFLGYIPEAVVYAYAGSQLTNLTNLSQIMTLEVILALGLIVILGLIPSIHKLIEKRKDKKEKILQFEDKPMFN